MAENNSWWQNENNEDNPFMSERVTKNKSINDWYKNAVNEDDSFKPRKESEVW